MGKDRVRIVNIPHTEYRVTANWDPILSKRELQTPMFALMKSNKEENLKKEARIELFYNLIHEVEVDRRGNEHLVSHDIAEYLHPQMKKAANVVTLNWLMKKTYNKRQSSRVIPLAHKLFLFHQLLEVSKKLFEDHPIKKWKKPPVFEKFLKEYMNPMEERLLHDALKTGGTKTSNGKNGKKTSDFTQPGSSLTHFPVCIRVANARPTWFLTRIQGASCPKCGHDNMVAVETRSQLENKRGLVMSEFRLASATWVDNGSDPKEKPVKPSTKMPEQHVVCMCPLLATKMPMTGEGCFICEDFVKAQGIPNWDFEAGRSNCTSCNCNCNCYFPLGRWQDVLTWVREEENLKKEAHAKEVAKRCTKQEVLTNFLAATNAARDRSSLASTGAGILRDEELNSDIALRESIQKITPQPSKYVTLQDGSQMHINQFRAPNKRPKNQQRLYNNNLIDVDLPPSVSGSKGSSTRSSLTADPILGRNVFRPSSCAGSLGDLTQTSYAPSQPNSSHYNEQYKPFRRAISEQLKVRTDLSVADRKRLTRIYKILCGETEGMTDVVRSIADDALTDLVTTYANHDPDEALAHVVKQGIDEMVGMFVSMVDNE